MIDTGVLGLSSGSFFSSVSNVTNVYIYNCHNRISLNMCCTVVSGIIESASLTWDPIWRDIWYLEHLVSEDSSVLFDVLVLSLCLRMRKQIYECVKGFIKIM